MNLKTVASVNLKQTAVNTSDRIICLRNQSVIDFFPFDYYGMRTLHIMSHFDM